MAGEHDERTPQGYMLAAGEGVAGYDGSVKASGRSTGGALTLIESTTEGGAPLHVHANEDEYFYVVDGTIVVQCGDEEWQAGPRSFVFLPRGVPHSWDVLSGIATVLMLTVPSMLEAFLAEYHAVSGAERDAVAARYDITFLPQ